LRSGLVHTRLLLIKLQQLFNGTAFQAVKFQIDAIISKDALLDYFLQEKRDFMAVDQPISF